MTRVRMLFGCVYLFVMLMCAFEIVFGSNTDPGRHAGLCGVVIGSGAMLKILILEDRLDGE